jgi:arylsulfatase
VFILLDNVGYRDLGPYGGGELRGAPKPRIGQLAREGLRLTQFLVEPACTPPRAALMTGQYSIRSGLSLILVPGSPNTRCPAKPSPWPRCSRMSAMPLLYMANGTWV